MYQTSHLCVIHHNLLVNVANYAFLAEHSGFLDLKGLVHF